MSRPPRIRRRTTALVWAIRLLPVTVLASLAPDVVAWLRDEPGAAQALNASAPVILGVGALRTLAGSFAVTPIATLTGWSWHLPLRRDLGRWAFALAALDLLLAVVLHEDGAAAGAAGHLFLSLGTLATLLLLPMALTSNRWSQARLGRWWRRLHLLIYPILAILVAHLLLLPDGPSSTVQMTWLFGPSLLLRVPRIKRAVIRRRLALTAAWRARRRRASTPAATLRWSTARRRRVVAAAIAGPVVATAAVTCVAISAGGLGAWLSPGPDPNEAEVAAPPAPAAAPAPAPSPSPSPVRVATTTAEDPPPPPAAAAKAPAATTTRTATRARRPCRRGRRAARLQRMRRS